MNRLFITMVLISSITFLSSQNFSPIYNDQAYPGISEQIGKYKSLWSDLEEKTYCLGFLNLLVTKNVDILNENSTELSFSEKSNPEIIYKIMLEGAGSKWQIRIGSSEKSDNMNWLPYRTEVICVPGNGSIYVITGEMYFGAIIEKYKLDHGECRSVDLPMNLLCKEKTTEIGNQDIYYFPDEKSDKVGQIASGSEVDIIGMRDYSKSNSSFSAWLFVRTKSGLSGWIKYIKKIKSMAG
jgi:hypothetical protein